MCITVTPESQTCTSPESPLSIDTEDAGIVFIARTSTPESLGSTHSRPVTSSPSRNGPNNEPSTPTSASTVTESTLPWRRSTLKEEQSTSVPLKQEEFPPWIDNKDYMPCYASPTNTFLGKLNESNNNNDVTNNARFPTVYEIFTILESGENAPGSRSNSGSSDGGTNAKDSGSITRGRFQCTSASPSGDQNSSQANTSSAQADASTVAINMAFEADDPSSSVDYRL